MPQKLSEKRNRAPRIFIITCIILATTLTAMAFFWLYKGMSLPPVKEAEIIAVSDISSEKSVAACKPVVAVYPTWKHSAETLEQLPWHRFNHIAVVFAFPKEDGQLDISRLIR